VKITTFFSIDALPTGAQTQGSPLGQIYGWSPSFASKRASNFETRDVKKDSRIKDEDLTLEDKDQGLKFKDRN